ncbi:GNAT family N-acetyltransferase, partial [Brevundimonas denitrificans]|uniref:GNAT family N-acetyltransferase n=1 Tax=Brevundimonas denitrificans TaxID=1443434 RepID=UPI0024E04206
TEIYVLYIRGIHAGYAELDFRKFPSVVDLAYFGIMPEFIGMKLGPYLLNWAIEQAWRRNPDLVTVNTCTLDHPKALPLYQRFGFTPYRQREVLIDPVED